MNAAIQAHLGSAAPLGPMEEWSVFTYVLDALQHGLRAERKADGQRVREACLRLHAALKREPLNKREAGRIKELLAEHDRAMENAEILRGRDRDGPTPETVRRSRGSIIDRLYKSGRIGQEDLISVAEMRAAHRKGASSGAAVTVNLTEPRVDISRQPRCFPPGGMGDWTGIYVRRLQEWHQAAGEKGFQTFAIIDVIVYDRAARDVEREWEMRNGSLLRSIPAAVHEYTILRQTGQEGTAY